MVVWADVSSPLRVDGYLRVSQVGKRRGERFISPKVQREEIEAWAQRRGALLLTVFTELDESGGRADRPLLEEAIGRIEGGISQGLVVYYTDRFGRSLIDGLLKIRRIQVADGAFFSINEGFDTSTDAGRLVLRIMLSLAEWDAERRSAHWRVALAQAVRRGVLTNSRVPVGYRRSRSGRLQVEPTLAPVIAEVFTRRATGVSLMDLARFLEGQGVLTSCGYPGWRDGTVQRLIRRREYLGEVHAGANVNPTAHPALVDAATWHAAQIPPKKQPSGTHNVKALLAGGLARCANCGMTLVAGSRCSRSRRYGFYYCRCHFNAGTCSAPGSASAVLLEPCVEDIVFGILARRRRAPARALQTASDELQQAEDALVAYRDSDRILTAIGEERFAAGLTVRAERIRDLSLHVASLRARHAIHQLPATTVLEARWPTMNTAQRRQLIATVIDCVFVGPGHGNVDQRVVACPTGTAPLGLGQRTTKYRGLRRPKPRRGSIMPDSVLGHTPRWSVERLQRELTAFVGERTDWPTREDFHRAGRARLHRQVLVHGGDAYWACRFGLPVTTVPYGSWTEERLRLTLTHYLRDKTIFPTATQMRADGQAALVRGIGKTGGFRRWTPEFDLPRPKRATGHRRKRWTTDDIAAELAAFCKNRDTFPAAREFKDAGLGGLHCAIHTNGGANWWAQQFGLARIRPTGSAKAGHPIPGRLFPLTDETPKRGIAMGPMSPA
jgi:DNA invertase Pin-like site-specific DNA recombinase